jgi:eukaryotic-like serine/threonine-protein kinase
MEDNDDNKKPENMQTDPTISASSEQIDGALESSSFNKAHTSGPSDRSDKMPSTGEDSNKTTSGSFSIPREGTVNDRSGRSEPASSQSGTFINSRYRIEREIARGGMGRVFMATQLPLGRLVAIKVLRSEFTDGDPKFPKRFFLEASVSSQLVHPNIITIHDYGETDNGDLFMAMEYLEGVSLSHYVKRYAPLDQKLVIHIALQIARAVRVAHKRNVIHRDLKPGNVMVVPRGEDEHFIKVLDFGLVKMLESSKQDPTNLEELANLDLDDENHPVNLTKAGVLLGSPRYMSPEQIRGENLDGRTDIYALGIILYQMLSGRSPFMGKTSIDVIYQHIHHSVPPIDNVACDENLEAITRKCLIKDRDSRYSTMSEVIDELKDVQMRLHGRDIDFTSDSQSQGPVFSARANSARSFAGGSRRNSANKSASISPRVTVRAAAFEDSGINLSQDRTPTNSAQFVVETKPASKRPIYLGILGLSIAVAAFVAFPFVKANMGVTTVPQSKTEQAPVRKKVEPKVRPSPAGTVQIVSEPSGAEVYINGNLIGTTPTQFKAPLNGTENTVLVKRRDYQDWRTTQILSEAISEIRATLVPVIKTKHEEPKKKNPPRIRPRQKNAQTRGTSTRKGKKKAQGTRNENKTDKKSEKKQKKYRNNPY